MKYLKFLGMTSALALATPAMADDVIIGVVVSTTSTYAFVGQPLVNGMRLAADELTANSGWGGHNVEILYEDNRSDRQEAIALITRMALSREADIIIGPIASSEAMATGPVAVDLGIPMFTTADAYMAPVAEHVIGLTPEDCFLVSIRDNDGYILQRDVFRGILEEGDVSIAGDETVLSVDTDFTALSTLIVNTDADCLFVTAPPEQAANIIIQARQAGLHRRRRECG
jgi:branched-chain amino acid transport system substrate-binding protein